MLRNQFPALHQEFFCDNTYGCRFLSQATLGQAYRTNKRRSDDVVKDIDRVFEYNWALLVFNKLRDAVLAFKLEPSKTYICGCVYFL